MSPEERELAWIMTGIVVLLGLAVVVLIHTGA
jgi:hypothetical protein